MRSLIAHPSGEAELSLSCLHDELESRPRLCPGAVRRHRSSLFVTAASPVPRDLTCIGEPAEPPPIACEHARRLAGRGQQGVADPSL